MIKFSKENTIDKKEVTVPTLVGQDVQQILLAARHYAIVDLSEVRVKSQKGDRKDD